LISNNNRPCWICVWERPWQGNHMIIVTESFLKSTIFKMFSGVFKLILFKERFRKDVFVTD